MSLWPRLFLILVLAALVARPAAAFDIDCSLTPIARMPLAVEDHALVVPVGINGQWVHLVVDTGAQRTMLSAATVDRLGLPRDDKAVHRWIGVGGVTSAADAMIGRMVVGGVHFPVDRVAVGPLNLHNNRGLDADGLLGADILLAFEMDIDAPDHTLTLYRNRVCPHARPPWPTTPIEILGVRRQSDKLMVPFRVDNLDGMAIVDTGARMNVLGQSMARRLGLTDEKMIGDPIERMVGTGGVVNGHVHQFGLFQVGPIAEVGASLRVLPGDFGVGDGLIGVEFMEGRRVWLSFKNPQIFVSKRPDER